MNVYLGTIHLGFYQILAQSDFKYGHQVAILEKQLSAVTNAWIISKF
jgi:hypothetical protein